MAERTIGFAGRGITLVAGNRMKGIKMAGFKISASRWTRNEKNRRKTCGIVIKEI